jgi:4-hydroxybenzoate polyprenyltransferase
MTEQGIRDSGLARFLRLIRFSHTVFALPFALGALVVAGRGRPNGRVLILVITCMVFARTAAMLFNRIVDWSLDQQNPRTAARHSLVRKSTAWTALLVSAGGFAASAACINWLTRALAPVALAIVFFYSVTKRFTPATHFFLGLALAIAPIGAWIAQTGRVDLPPLVLGAGVVCWVSGFDLIYATQDYEFDRASGLRSLVVSVGPGAALRLAEVLHVVAFMALIAFGLLVHMRTLYLAAMLLIGFALIYEHRVASRGNVAAINRAFFETNAFVSVVFLAGSWLDCLMRGVTSR